MKTLFYLIIPCIVFCSCRPDRQATHAAAHGQGHKISLCKLDKLSCTGDFDGDGKIDT
jgi:hypothetical protein